jgi:hypothetical protein
MLVTAFVAAQLAGTLELLDTTRVDARWSYPLTIVTSPRREEVVIAGDVSTVPLARLVLRGRHLQLTMTYSPNIIAPDFEIPDPIQVLQTLTAAAAWREREVTVTLLENASYGQLNSTYLYGGGLASGATQGLPSQTTTGTGTAEPGGGATGGGTTTASTAAAIPGSIPFGSFTTMALVNARLSRRYILVVSGGYQVSGGLETAAQLETAAEAYLPLQYGPLGMASLTYRLSANDSVSAIANGVEATTYGGCPPPLTGNAPAITAICRTESLTSVLQANVRHAFSARTTLTVGAGAAVTIEPTQVELQPGVVPEDLEILPYATVSLFHRFQGPDSLLLTTQLGPVIDSRTGLPNERAQALLRLTRAITERVTMLAAGSFTQSVPIGSDPYPITALNASIESRTLINRQLTVLLGLAGVWQSQVGYTNVGAVIAYAGLTGRLPTMKF